MLRKIACTISLLRQKEADLCRSISFGKAKRDVDKGIGVPSDGVSSISINNNGAFSVVLRLAVVPLLEHTM